MVTEDHVKGVHVKCEPNIKSAASARGVGLGYSFLPAAPCGFESPPPTYGRRSVISFFPGSRALSDAPGVSILSRGCAIAAVGAGGAMLSLE